MSNAELWDLDTSGGLMEQIKVLTSPDESSDALRRSRRKRDEIRDVYVRKTGRSVNHDSCDSCKEGGDLLCCDKCPAAFHFLCHDPPLDEEDVPNGEWICHKCKSTAQETKEDDTESTSSKSSVKSGRGKRPASSLDAYGEAENPLKVLIKAAKLMNPSQFDVGKEISCNRQLPGSSKRVYGKAAAKNLPKRQPHELDSFGLVPLPAKVCFACNKSCRVAPLIQCDYCPLLFHMDCLDPPPTTLPQGRWMCPNHVEQYLDSNLLKSQSLTERLCLWDRFGGLVNSHTVKVDFLNKVHRRNPCFRYKRKLPSRPSISVPEAIKTMYEHPSELLPPPPRGPPPATSTEDLPGTRGKHITTLDEQEQWLRSVVAMQTSIAKHIEKRQMNKLSNETDSSHTLQKPTASVAPVQKETESQGICDNASESSKSTSSCSTTSALELGECDSKPVQQSSNSRQDPLEVSSFGQALSLLNNNINGRISKPLSHAYELSNGVSQVSEDCEMKEDRHRLRSNSIESLPSPAAGKPWNIDEKIIMNGSLSSNHGYEMGKLSSKVQSSGNKFNDSSFANNNCNHIPSRSHKTKRSPAPGTSSIQERHNLSSVSVTSSVHNLNNALQQWMAEGGDLEIGKIDVKLTQLLAWQRLQQLTSTKSLSNSVHSKGSTYFSKSSLPSSSGKKGLLNTYLSQQNSASEVRARAVLCPVSGRGGEPIHMPYRALTLGKGPGMDVNLNEFGFCNYLSSHHATIFYDEIDRHFELLNYSEYGTKVDSVVYSCDVNDKPSTTPKVSPLVASVREVVKKKKGKKSKEESNKEENYEGIKNLDEENKLKMSARNNEELRACGCSAPGSSGAAGGWEGTALLHHGSQVKVGCLNFVFSIVDQAPDQHSGRRRDGSSNTAAAIIPASFSSSLFQSSNNFLVQKSFDNNSLSLSHKL